MDYASLIGNTPLITLEGIYAKLETMNLTGSVKDRMAAYMIAQAEAEGQLRRGQLIIEATSGNTGISLAALAAAKGYKFLAVMPENMSLERRKMLQLLGAQLVLTPAEQDMVGAMRKYEELVKEHPDAWLPRQFTNPANIEAHYAGLGRELKKIAKDIEAFVAGVGTGGTLLGVAKALRENNPAVRIVAVEPAEAAVLSGQKPEEHGIQGIGEGFIPKIVQDHRDLIDEVITIGTQEAIAESKRLAQEHGLLVGYSSGANMLAAKRLKERGLRVATVLCDRGERYLEQ